MHFVHMFEGSLEVKLPTIWTNGKAQVGRVREEKRREGKRREGKREEKGREEKRREEEKKEEERRKKKKEERRSKKRKSQEKEDPGARHGRKVAKRCVFQWFVAPEGRKVGSLKQRARSHVLRWEMKSCTPLWCEANCAKHTMFGPLLGVEMSKKCTALWREAHFEVKMGKTPQLGSTFRSCDVEKVHGLVARSKFRSQNVQNTSASEHF